MNAIEEYISGINSDEVVENVNEVRFGRKLGFKSKRNFAVFSFKPIKSREEFKKIHKIYINFCRLFSEKKRKNHQQLNTTSMTRFF